MKIHAGIATKSQTQNVPPQDLLLVLGDQLDDLEQARIVAQNRIRAMVSPPQAGPRGGTHGKGFPADHPVIERMRVVAAGLEALERSTELALKRCARKLPFWAHVRKTTGLGEKTVARLIGAIGLPHERPDKESGEMVPRTLAQLRSYCGYDGTRGGSGHSRCGADPGVQEGAVAASTPRKGFKGYWSRRAKTAAFLIAEGCVKCPGGFVRYGDGSITERKRSPYRDVYDAAREKYAEALHAAPCKRCGPAGKPAPEGSPLSAGHQHARAMRLVVQAILRDLHRWSKDSSRAGDHGRVVPSEATTGESSPARSDVSAARAA
jgi:hypothetical protein